jgi:hypothetical protein
MQESDDVSSLSVEIIAMESQGLAGAECEVQLVNSTRSRSVARNRGHSLAWLISDCCVSSTDGGGPCHSGPRRIDLLCILQRHPRRLPSAGLGDCRQINIKCS